MTEAAREIAEARATRGDSTLGPLTAGFMAVQRARFGGEAGIPTGTVPDNPAARQMMRMDEFSSQSQHLPQAAAVLPARRGRDEADYSCAEESCYIDGMYFCILFRVIHSLYICAQETRWYVRCGLSGLCWRSFCVFTQHR